MSEILAFTSVDEHILRQEQGGRLTLGFWWVNAEEVDFRQLFYLGGWLVGGFLAFVLLGQSDPWGFLFLVVAIVCLPLWWKARPMVASRVLAATFASDGVVGIVDEVRKPKKVDPNKLPWMTLKRTIDEIANISLQPTKTTTGGHYRFVMSWGGAPLHLCYSIVIDFTTGERITLGNHLTERSGRIIQVQLNQALHTIRAERLERMARQAATTAQPEGSEAPKATDATGGRWAPFGH